MWISLLLVFKYYYVDGLVKQIKKPLKNQHTPDPMPNVVPLIPSLLQIKPDSLQFTQIDLTRQEHVPFSYFVYSFLFHISQLGFAKGHHSLRTLTNCSLFT